MEVLYNMNKLNKSLFTVLAVFLIVSCIGSVIAYSDEGSGSIVQVDDDSIEDANNVIVVSEGSGNSSSSVVRCFNNCWLLFN